MYPRIIQKKRDLYFNAYLKSFHDYQLTLANQISIICNSFDNLISQSQKTPSFPFTTNTDTNIPSNLGYKINKNAQRKDINNNTNYPITTSFKIYANTLYTELPLPPILIRTLLQIAH